VACLQGVLQEWNVAMSTASLRRDGLLRKIYSSHLLIMWLIAYCLPDHGSICTDHIFRSSSISVLLAWEVIATYNLLALKNVNTADKL
jgi:hypothetical protein